MINIGCTFITRGSDYFFLLKCSNHSEEECVCVWCFFFFLFFSESLWGFFLYLFKASVFPCVFGEPPPLGVHISARSTSASLSRVIYDVFSALPFFFFTFFFFAGQLQYTGVCVCLCVWGSSWPSPSTTLSSLPSGEIMDYSTLIS